MKELMAVREEGGKLVWYQHEVLVPCGGLTAAQRRALDRVVGAWPNPQRKERTDLLVQLYKAGAKKDLSNVKIGFTAIGGHGVELEFQVHTPPTGGVMMGELVAYL